MTEHTLTFNIVWLLSVHQRGRKDLVVTGLLSSDRCVCDRSYRRSSEISNSLKRTFELALMTEMYPMSKIDVFVQVLQSDGGNEAVSYIILLLISSS